MGLLDKLKEPVFLKESRNAVEQLEKLKDLEQYLNDEGKSVINKDIKYLEYGIFGENTIAYELKNSHMPMYILHDIYFECGDLNAQIDYIVFTKKLCFLIECKNLYGDIEINNNGDFIRTMKFAGKKIKEGIYSPITQNQRHLELMKKIRSDSRSNFFTRMMTEKFFEDFVVPVVVLANPKTILHDKYAKKEVKEKVIRGDQLISFMKEANEKSKEGIRSDNNMLEWAQTYLDFHKDIEKDYTKKYEVFKEVEVENELSNNDIVNTKESNMAIEDTELFKELKKFRLDTSRAENIKPYFIYNDMQLKELISKNPSNKDEMLTVAGFGNVKIEKYGEEILKIMSKHS